MSYEEAMVDLRDTIGRINCRVFLTADLWTRDQNLGYLRVIFHVIQCYVEKASKLELRRKCIPHNFRQCDNK